MKLIVRRAAAVVTFFGLLAGAVPLSFSEPQLRHCQRFCDLLVMTSRRKTLAQLAAMELGGVDPSNLADFFRISPWEPDDLRLPLCVFILQYLATKGISKKEALFLTIDDSLACKDKATHKLDTVDWQFDHNHHCAVKASNHVVLGIHWGGYHFPLLWRMYLRACTVRKINKRKGTKLRYYSKLELTQQMLEQIRQHLPPGVAVYVLFDSWYTSAQLVKWIRTQGWHVIAAVKSNRKLSGQKLTDRHRALKGQRYEKVRVVLANGGQRKYYVRSQQGYLKGVPGEVRVLISQKAPGAHSPRYFLCTDLKLTAHKILNWYQKRWHQEVDYWLAKLELGLADFRLQDYAAISKWYAVVYCTLVYLYWRCYEEAKEGEPALRMAEVLAEIRQAYQRQVLEQACAEVSAGVPIAEVVAKYVDGQQRPAA